MIDSCSLEPNPLLTVDNALEKIRTAIQPVSDSETVPLKTALGRVLAESVYSPNPIPHERNSAMDGYAFASRDVPNEQPFTLTLIGTSWAGNPFQGQLQTGQCVRIFTGAVLPEQADSVIMQEYTQRDAQQVHFPAHTQPQQNVRAIGEDVQQGGLLCTQSKKLTAVDLTLLATAGVSEVCVHRAINIAIFSTGDELIALGQPLATGQIYDSNRYLLNGLLSACYQVADLGVIADNKHALTAAFTATAKNYDVIISTGGASVGEADYVKDVLTECGQINFWKLAIKPGKPLTFGTIGACYFFGLPGNPVSAHVTFQKIVAPALQQLTGATATRPLQLTATCTSVLKKSAGRQEFQRGILTQTETGELLVATAGQQGSNILSALSIANCYIVLPSDNQGVAVGDKVLVEPFSVLM